MGENSKPVYISYTDSPEKAMRELYQKAGIAEQVTPDDIVVIKPNVLNAKSSETGAVTDPALVEQVIVLLQESGVQNITLAEGAWLGAETTETFNVNGYYALAEKYRVNLVDLKNDTFVDIPLPLEDSILKKVKVAQTMVNASKIINVPVLKAHCQTRLTCGMKNLMGAISDSEKRRFHKIGLDRAIFELNTVIKPAMNICDAIIGDLTFEEGGTPVALGMLFASNDIFFFDAYAADTIGFTVDEIEYLRLYKNHFTINDTFEPVQLNEPTCSTNLKALNYQDRYASFFLPKGACCSCLASVFYALETHGESRPDMNFYIGAHINPKDIYEKGVNIFIGNCTRKYSEKGIPVRGCPPSGNDIVNALIKNGM